KDEGARLRAMREKEVRVGGNTYPSTAPFFVRATQNQIDQEGTSPLPEAQKDRFLLNTFIKSPNLDEEEEIVERTTGTAVPQVQSLCGSETLLKLQQLVSSLPLSKHVPT